MQRRRVLKSLAMIGTVPVLPALASAAPAAKHPIQLHTDLNVKLEEEKQLLEDFKKKYLPRVRKAPGFIDAQLLKFRKANIGEAPTGHNYRLVQTFASEELREKWTVAEGHKIAWHEALESHVKVPFTAYLYEINGDA